MKAINSGPLGLAYVSKWAAVLCAFATITGILDASERPEKPNVLLILTDDLGWQDVGCYDIDEPTPYETPHIDRLATEGVKFWQAYSPAPTCAPTRGAILAGKHPARLQRTHVVGGNPPLPHTEAGFQNISPWYRGRLPISETIIPEALNANGYATGHVGKWHVAINHNSYPQPDDHGFDFTRSDRGATNRQKPDRLSEFATSKKNDPYRLDENGFPFHQNNVDALDFIEQNKEDPFFLYYATWLVHAPIHTRSEALLRKYCEKMGVPFPENAAPQRIPGQNNPYYGAMVEMLDYYVGQVFDYLRTTDDPRWPGHKLIENTYIIFTSDNGGMEGNPKEIYTDNFPLDRGKISAKEGGIRVPLIISGPGIIAGQETDVIANGMDFYPTILSWTGTEQPAEQAFDGADLAPLLVGDVSNANLVKEASGEVRNSVMHHFPNSAAMHSTLRIDGYKLVRNYNPQRPPLELYRLYEKNGDRGDIEEMKNLALSMPEKAEAMNAELQKRLEAMDASFPFLNPFASKALPFSESICSVQDDGRKKRSVWAKYEESGNRVTHAYLLYTLNGGESEEEWFRMDAELAKGNLVRATLPKGTTHYLFNLVDEHNFMVSHPRMGGKNDHKKGQYSLKALSAN